MDVDAASNTGARDEAVHPCCEALLKRCLPSVQMIVAQRRAHDDSRHPTEIDRRRSRKTDGKPRSLPGHLKVL